MAHMLTSDALSARRWADAGRPPTLWVEEWDGSAWEDLLALAVAHGWEPAGTQAPVVYAAHGMEMDPPTWDGNYETQDYQVVTAEDAAHLADALERVLREYWAPARVLSGGLVRPGWAVGAAPETGWGGGGGWAPPWPPPWLTRRQLEAVIAFCRRGAFDIG